MVPYVLFIFSWIVVAIFVPRFGTLSHFRYVLQFAGFLGLASIGQTLIVISGGIDLSIGAVLTLSAVTVTQTMYAYHFPFLLAVIVAFVVACLFGALNGFGVGILRIPPLIMTLSSSTIAKGVALVLTNGSPHEIRNEAFQEWVVTPSAIGINGTLQTWVIASAFIVFLMSSTTFGKKLFLLGSNPTAAKYAGINSKRLIISVFIVGSLFSAITGILLIGFTGNSYLGMGDSYQSASLAAVVMGGSSILGGSGSYFGTIAGALLLTLIGNVLTLFSVSGGGQMAIQGLLLLGLMIIYTTTTRARE